MVHQYEIVHFERVRCLNPDDFCSFTDKQVLQPDFKEELGRLVTIMRPFVHWSVLFNHLSYGVLTKLLQLERPDDYPG